MMLPRYVPGGVQEFRRRCGDKHEYFSETPDLALVKAVIAHAARRKKKRDTFVELTHTVPAEFRTTHVGKLRKASQHHGEMKLRKGLVSCSLSVGTVSRCCLHNESHSVAGTVHGDDMFVAGPRQDFATI